MGAKVSTIRSYMALWRPPAGAATANDCSEMDLSLDR